MAALTVQSSGYFPEYNIENPSIPVIHNVVSNEDLQAFTEKNRGYPKIHKKEANMGKVLKLLTDKHSKPRIERHCRAVRNLSSFYKDGVHLNDVIILMQIIKKCYEYIALDDRYEELVCLLVSTMRRPFLKSKSSDEERYMHGLPEHLTTLGQIGEESPVKIKVVIGKAVSDLYTSKSNSPKSLDLKPVSQPFVKTTIERSRICKSIAEYLGQIPDNDYDSRYTLLKSLNKLSNSDLNCDDILKTDAVFCICKHLETDLRSYKLLFVAVETLWNLLQNGDPNEFSGQLSCDACLNSLHATFTYQMSHCCSLTDRQLRNDILIIISLVASKCTMSAIIESGLVKTLSLFCTSPELPSRNEMVENMKIQSSPEDFELKKLLFNLIVILSDDSESLQIMSKCYVLHALFTYVQPITQSTNTLWSAAQFEEIQLQAMSVLAVLAPLLVNQYMECQGNARLLNLLDWCVGQDDYGGHGNSFYGMGGRGSKRAQMRYCIRLIRSMCSTGDEEVLQDLTDQGLIAQLIAILDSCSHSTDSNDAVDIELQCDMMLILASLCDEDVHRKELFGESGVDVLLQYMKGYLIVNGPLNQQKLVLYATDCIWSSVIGCYMNEITFLEKEGAFLLLDLLQECPENMQNVVLGTILDLTENTNCLPHVMLWRGRNEKTVGKLLVDLWKEEEKKFGVRRDAYGVITDTSCPLMTASQESHGIVSLPVSFSSPAIVEVADNLRAKIYSIFCQLGFNNLPGLVSADYVVLSIIEKYLDFKTMEVWQEIRSELMLENIEPVSPDKECIDRIIFTFEEKAAAVVNVQKSLIENDIEEELVEEREFYSKIKESHTQEEKTYQDFVNFVDRTSDYSILQAVRKEQLKSIDRSRLLSRTQFRQKKSTTSHETMERKLQITTFCGRNVLVKSTEIHHPVNSSTKKHFLQNVQKAATLTN